MVRDIIFKSFASKFYFDLVTNPEFAEHMMHWDDAGFSDNSSYPRFTPCFRDSVPVWVPCGWLWLTLPVNIYLFRTSSGPKLPVTALNMAKLILDLILGVVTIIDTLRAVSEEELSFLSPNMLIISGYINTATFGLAAVYTQIDRCRGSITSTSLFVFWLLKVVCNVVDFYTLIIEHNYEDHLFRFILFYSVYGLLLVQLILHSFAEKEPVENSDVSENFCPERKASVLNVLYFWWMNSLIIKAYRKPLSERDVWTLQSRDQSRNIVERFDINWRQELTKAYLRNSSVRTQHIYDSQQTTSSGERTPLLDESLRPMKILVKPSSVYKGSLITALFKTFGWTYIMSLGFKLLSDVLQFVGPIMIWYLIAYADDREDKPLWKGYLPVIGIFISGLVQSVFYHQNYRLGMAIGMRVRCSLVSAIYKKALTLSSSSKQNISLGKIVNLMSVDCENLQDLFAYLWMVMSVPVQTVFGIYLLWGLVQISCLAGMGLMILLVPLNFIIESHQLKLKEDILSLKGERIKLMSEIINGIKVLKMYTWESSFKHKVTIIRERELDKLRKVACLQGLAIVCWMLAPYLVFLVTFASYVNLDQEDNVLTAKKAFVTLALFYILITPMNMLAKTISSLVQSKVSLRRIVNFLSCEDLDPQNVQHVYDTDYAVKIERGTFSWNKRNPQSTLRDINITIPEGQLVAIVGCTGVGKSSLISAVLGEMLKIDGSVSLKGSVAYAPQEPWIQNATLMDNILFGKSYMQKKYKRVLEACALTSDLDILPGRDLTEIGEKRINLSPGQKQRVSLARAVYSNSDVYLMDDPLSEVDPHVAKLIFDKVIGSKSLLKNKTRILVTHRIHWLPLVDRLVVMERGKIMENGSYQSLINHDGPLVQFLKQSLKEENFETDDDPEEQKIREMMLKQVSSVTSDGLTTDEPTNSTMINHKHQNPKEGMMKTVIGSSVKLIQEEPTDREMIKWSVFSFYSKILGICSAIWVILLFSLYNGVSVFSNFWLAFWTHDNDDYLNNGTTGSDDFRRDTHYFLLGFGFLGIVQVLLVMIYAFLLSVKMVKAAGKLHSDMLETIMRAQMEFFNTTSPGQIVNRFSRDIDTLDTVLPLTFHTTFYFLYLAIMTIIVISINTPLILTAVVLVTIVYGIILKFYLPASRQLKRLESMYRPPIYNHFSEILGGASTIRAYKATERFIEESLKRLDRNMVYYYAKFSSTGWLGVRVEILGNFLVVAAGLFSIFSELDGPGVGLSLVYAFQASYILNYLATNLSDLQSNMVSVERVKEFTELQPEAARRQGSKPAHWPRSGKVVFHNYKMQYSEDGDLVLRGIDLKIKHGEKIGIVGNTGSGKSSLVSALLRFVEASEGYTTIDGVDISTIGLHDLREKVTIMSQNPVLFSGSLWSNLDPFGCYGDDQLWNVLEKSHMKDEVISLHGQLDFQCGEGGQNFSIGHRQLICLARALLMRNKLLILDDVMVGVDPAMEELIHQTILQEFKGCTIISITRKLKTVIGYDRIVVMENGQIIECDTPDNLLSDPNTVFYSLAEEAGVIKGQQIMDPVTSLKIDSLSDVGADGHIRISEIGKIQDEEDHENCSKSSSSLSSQNGLSGHEASAELSNGITYNKKPIDPKSSVESSSMDSVRFGDVTIVTPQDIPPMEEPVIKLLSSSPITGLNQKQHNENQEEYFMKPDDISNQGNLIPDRLDPNSISEKLIYSDSSGSKESSDKTDYYSAESHVDEEDVVLSSPVEGASDHSSGEETLHASQHEEKFV